MKNPILRALATLTLVMGLFGFSPMMDSADAHSNYCPHTSITVYEGLNLTGDAKVFCGNVSDLNSVTHTQSGNCDEHWLGDNSWDDCISSWRVNNNTHGYCIQIFGNPSYVTPLLEGGFRGAGYWSNMDGGTGSGGEENKATSIRFTETSICGSNS